MRQDDDEKPEGAVGAIIAFDTVRTKLVFNDGVGEVHARLCAFGGGGEDWWFTDTNMECLQVSAAFPKAPLWLTPWLLFSSTVAPL